MNQKESILNNRPLEGEIKNLWTYSGVVHIKFPTDLEEPPMKIFHKDDIEFYMNYDSAFEVIS